MRISAPLYRSPLLRSAVVALTAAFGSLSAPAQSPAPSLKMRQPPLLSAARQLVLVVTPDWNATTGTLRRFERQSAGSRWSPAGSQTDVVVGRSGIAWGDAALASSADEPVKREGDGRAPAGVFPLDTAFGFAARADLSWLRMPYAALQPGSDCVDDVTSVRYNTIVDKSAAPQVDWTSAEHMRDIAQYRIGVIVGYNAAPPARGRGSCIFLHIWNGPASSTAGCTAMDADRLETLVKWLDRARRPVLVQLTVAQYARLESAWHLPGR